MEDVASLIRKRNAIEKKLSPITNCSMRLGDIGEYIASEVFHISLWESKRHRGSDGVFKKSPLKGSNVDVKFYPIQQRSIDISPNPELRPDYFLVLVGMEKNQVIRREPHGVSNQCTYLKPKHSCLYSIKER